MDDEILSNSEPGSPDINELIKQQAEMEREWQANQPFTPIRYDYGVTKFVIPQARNYTEKTISLTENPTEEQRLLFAALYTAQYRYFYTDEFAVTVKETYSQKVKIFVGYFNDYKFTTDNRIGVLKDFERYRVTVDKVKTQSTGLAAIVRWVIDALDYAEFRLQLTDIEYNYLYTLTKTKVAPRDPTTQTTMTEWFASHTWLRRNDIGVGHDRYSLLRSPKALVSSFRITVVTTLHEIQLAKNALIEFFIKTDWKIEEIPFLKKRGEFESNSSCDCYRSQYYSDALNLLRERYHQYPVEDESLVLAIKLIIADTTYHRSWDYVLESIWSNKHVSATFRNSGQRNFEARTANREILFSFPFVRNLIEYAASTTGPSRPVPTCDAEEIIFSWLMAYQTVQPSGISKLSSTDFRFVRDRKDRITHIDLQYFKRRSGAIHGPRMLKSKTELGKVVLQFLQDKGEFNETKNPIRCQDTYIGFSKNSKAGALFLSMQRYLRGDIEQALEKQQATTTFLDSIVALRKNGIRYNGRTHKSPTWYAKHIDTPAAKSVFGLSAIKNSSVHARSDTFTPTQLLNYHSHSNEVERATYLSPQNEQWLNNCGLITRAVMQDLTVNLFRASEKDQRVFNTEFTQSAETIDIQRDEILSRMKLITGKQKGHVDELGFTKYVNSSDLPGTLYLVDCPETVLKHKHYLAEAKNKYELLTANSPEFLLFRVLPTVEWIESLFELKRFSKNSIIDGEAMYEKFGKILPQLFTAKIGG